MGSAVILLHAGPAPTYTSYLLALLFAPPACCAPPWHRHPQQNASTLPPGGAQDQAVSILRVFVFVRVEVCVSVHPDGGAPADVLAHQGDVCGVGDG